VQDPLKQGLKLKKLCNLNKEVISVEVQDPLKQGLKRVLMSDC